MINENIEIKKELYKQKPKALFQRIIKGYAIYMTDQLKPYLFDIYFNVPLDDIGETAFYPEMEAHLLIRYLVFNDNQLNKNNEG